MGKKHKKQTVEFTGASVSVLQEAEYRTIKKDLVHLMVLNGIYLFAILALYYSNLKTNYLEKWFSGLLGF